LEKIIESLKEELENATKGSGPFGNNEEIEDRDFNEDFREVII